jgi:hypothetical protein
MKRYYTRTFVGLGLVFVTLLGAAVLSNSAAGDARLKHARLLEEAKAQGRRTDIQRERLERLQRAIQPVQEFSAAWRPIARLNEREAAEKVRSELEAVAQRQLGLVTDNAITPQPEKFTFQGVPIRVQRVTLRASGKDLVALLTWLGKVEEKYPAALVESCEFSSNVGGNTGLTVRLVHPLQDSGARRIIASAVVQEAALSPDAIAAMGWSQYLPARVKAPVAIGVQRNPLQPAVAAEARSLPIMRDETDEVTPRVEAALDKHLRSVIRGGTPIIVVDGRVFRTGDELIVGAGREKPVPEAKTKLKLIGDDRLVFHVAGGTVDHPIQCDVTYSLPGFLKAR